AILIVFFFQAEDGIRDGHVTGVQACALPIWVHEDDASGSSPGRRPIHPQDGTTGRSSPVVDERAVGERDDRTCVTRPRNAWYLGRILNAVNACEAPDILQLTTVESNVSVRIARRAERAKANAIVPRPEPTVQDEALLDITLASKSQTLLARGQIRVHAAECDRPAVHIEPGDFGIRRGVDLQLVHLKSPKGHAADLRSSVPAEDDFPGVWAHLILQIRLR